jgi:hypothetical protein
MLPEDVSYMTEGFLEAFQYLGKSIDYVACLTDGRNKFGEFEFVFDEANKKTVTCMFSRDAGADKDMTNFWTGRVNANATFVRGELATAGISLKEKDALDVTIDGVVRRFLVTGYPKDPVLDEVFVKVTITDQEHAFKNSTP